MEVLTVIGLGLGFDGTSNWINKNVAQDKYIPALTISVPRSTASAFRKFVLWRSSPSSPTWVVFCRLPRDVPLPIPKTRRERRKHSGMELSQGKDQVANEIKLSAWSICVMAAMTAPFELAVEAGYTKIYRDLSRHTTLAGWFYLLVGSPLLLLAFSDTCVYWIHRALHHRLLYAPIHKLHHKYKETTPFSSTYAFHPLDGWLQGCPHHIFVFLFPMHHVTYFLSSR